MVSCRLKIHLFYSNPDSVFVLNYLNLCRSTQNCLWDHIINDHLSVLIKNAYTLSNRLPIASVYACKIVSINKINDSAKQEFKFFPRF